MPRSLVRSLPAAPDPFGNFDNGQVKLKPGASATGYVTFQVPKDQKVTAVRYANTVYPGITAQWQVP